jgi:putative peptidoglycan lipid II flippase
MPGYAVQMILSRAYFARQDGKMPLVAGLLSIAVNIGLSVLLTGPLNVVGLAIASAAAATVNALILMLPLERRRNGFLSRAFIIDFIKMLVSAAVMALAASGLASVLTGVVPEGTLGNLITAAVPALLGAAVYFAVTALLRVTEARDAAGTVRRLLHRSKADR